MSASRGHHQLLSCDVDKATVKQFKGSRAVAELLGVSQRTVERYVKDQIRRPGADLAQRLADAVRARWQPCIREQARRQAVTSTGLMIDTRARFGFTAAPGTTDDSRLRHLTLALPPAPASLTPKPPAPPSSSCAPSPPRPWARSTSATAAAARTAWRGSRGDGCVWAALGW